MFLTLDNLRAEPTAGLLFVDWDTGAVLHLSGTTAIRDETSRGDGAERTVELHIQQVVERQHVVPLRWSPAATDV
jgi:hypothetical protein